jgi:hypothetical protein
MPPSFAISKDTSLASLADAISMAGGASLAPGLFALSMGALPPSIADATSMAGELSISAAPLSITDAPSRVG